MITPKINALFQFIEYLHSNIDKFNKYNYLIDELDNLYDKRNKLEPEKNYFEKKEYEKLQYEIIEKRKPLLQNTVEKAIKKATDLNIYNPKNYSSIYNQNKDEAFNIINVIDDKDLPIVLENKRKYIEFRTKTRNAILHQKDLYDKLDLILKVVFSYFDKETENEFAKLPKYEQLTVIKHHSKPSRQLIKTIQEKLSAFHLFQIEVVADLEFEGKTYKNVKHRNNDSILTPENWEQHKETFFTQRMVTYKDSYTLAEKIKLELSGLEKLPINNIDYQILKDRYKAYLEQKQTLPPQQNKKPKPEQETPKTFDELFYYTELVKPCIGILKELEPPLIDTDCNYIGKLKGVFCVWIDEMQRQGIIKSNFPEERKLFASLIPQKIKRFSIDESMFGKYQKKAEENYRTDIKTMVSKIKLSQNSH